MKKIIFKIGFTNKKMPPSLRISNAFITQDQTLKKRKCFSSSPAACVIKYVGYCQSGKGFLFCMGIYFRSRTTYFIPRPQE